MRLVTYKELINSYYQGDMDPYFPSMSLVCTMVPSH